MGKEDYGMRKPKSWKLTLTDEQFNCIARGMEIYHRLLCGQLSELNNLSDQGDLTIEDVSHLQRQLFPQLPHGSYYKWDGSAAQGEFHEKEAAQSYQVYRAMVYHRTIRDDKAPDWSVYREPPLASNKVESIKVEYNGK